MSHVFCGRIEDQVPPPSQEATVREKVDSLNRLIDIAQLRVKDARGRVRAGKSTIRQCRREIAKIQKDCLYHSHEDPPSAGDKGDNGDTEVKRFCNDCGAKLD